MKRYLSIILSVLLILQVFCVTAFAADNAAQFALSEVSGKVGETVSVQISVSSTEAYNSVALSSLTYDSSALKFVGFSYAEAITGKLMMEVVDMERKVFMLPLKSSEALSGNICTLQFEILTGAVEGNSYPVTMTSLVKDNATELTSGVTAGAVVIKPAHEHQGGTATCAAQAVCTECGESYGSLDAENHTGETEIRNAKTESCNEDGYTGDTCCKGCGDIFTEGTVIPATGAHVDANGKWESDGDNHWHTCGCETKFDVAAHTGGEATCIAQAACEICEAAYGSVNAENHKGETEIKDTKIESCNEDGYTGDTVCKDCGATLVTGTVIPATGAHVDADGKWESDGENHWHTCGCETKFDVAAHTGGEATCIAQAACEICEAAYGSVNADNHKGETEIRDASTESCKDDGYTGDTYCLDCGEKIADGTIIPSTGAHVDADGKWESDGENHWHTCDCGTKIDSAAHIGGEATCIELAKCSVCETSYGVVNAENHKGETEIRDAYAGTCDTMGYSGDIYCKDCNVKIQDGTATPFEHLDEDDDAYCDLCNVLLCTHSRVQIVNVKFENCAKDGYTGDTYCIDCGKLLAEGHKTYATGSHSSGEWIVGKEATETETGYQYKNCTVCGVTLDTEVIPLLEVEWVNPFTDVSEEAEYYEAVEFVYENELFIGVSEDEFAPEVTMTRAMFVTALGRLAGIDPAEYTAVEFDDVVAGEWYAPYVAWATANGIIYGYGDGTFGVTDEITVEQASVILARYAKFIEKYEESDVALDAYEDADAISDWALADMKWAVENNVYGGSENALNPLEKSPRYLVATMFYGFATTYAEN